MEIKLFRISKISTFESNSQRPWLMLVWFFSCSEYQRYQLLRAIHNMVVPIRLYHMLFRISKISTFESNSQPVVRPGGVFEGCSEYQRYQLLRAIHNGLRPHPPRQAVVPNIKDINFWEQFTTGLRPHPPPASVVPNIKDINFWEQFTTTILFIWSLLMLFRISKISTFESNSQPLPIAIELTIGCSEYQRYQLLRAIHNTFLGI